MKVLMIEDEFMVAKRLRRFIESAIGKELQQLTHLDNLDDAQAFVSDNSIDVLFLDLNLHGNDGFLLLQEQLSKSFHTIVVSANTDRAIEAFEFGVLDFIGKPFTQERINQAVARLTEQNPNAQCKFLSYKKLGQIQLLPVEDVLYLRASGHYCDVITRCGETVVHDKNIDRLLTLLGTNFVRIHRSYAVRLDAIASICAAEGSKYSLQLKDSTELPIGRTRVKKLKAQIGVQC
ncbi:DNA-binding response regulator [Alteromonas sediminis]|uniref:DNA-binding response regulator n=1 Tax=Alteromonas sediminis TaxID=2259342 RepID=A0A3N5Y656_9ALTE|nr:LytTR family DNA-binding domain-containing protein [Alteromonas sediminis]RPJ65849.1 DNA-binding response regulator [Alteromonas sediminis]